MAAVDQVELNVHHTSKHVCWRLRQPLKNNDRLTGGIGNTRFPHSFNKLRRGKQEEQESDGEFPGMKDFQ